MNESATRSYAAQWGPIALGVAPMGHPEELAIAAHEVWHRFMDVSNAADDKLLQYRNAENKSAEIQDALWNEYRELAREQNVLHGWYHVTRAAYLFMQSGFQSHYLEDEVHEIPMDESVSGMVFGLNPNGLRESC